MPGIPLTGSEGLFTRLGEYGNLINAINLSRGTTIPALVNDIQGQYTTTDQNIIDNLYSNLTTYQNACSSFNAPIKSMASATLIQMANESLPLANQNLSTALIYLIQQMIAQGQTVNQCTLSDSISYAGSNYGNPNIVVALHDTNGLLVENCFAELITATCTNDAQSNPNLDGLETVQFQSQFSVSDTFSWMYPAGSQTTLSLQAVSGMTNGGSGRQNWLMNGSFETWSPTAGGIPTSFHIGMGSAGTTILQSSSPVYDGSYALEFAGNGSENTALYQQFSTPAASYDTPSVIYPNMIFAFNMWIRMNAMPASGVFRVALWNGTSVIDDNSGNPNSVSVNLNTISTTWVPISGSFRTPNYLVPDTTIEFQLSLTTPLPSGKSLYIDRCSFTQLVRMYAGGPYLQLFSGNVNLIKGDSANIQINNSYNGLFQILFQKLFNMRQLGLILPSSVSPTIADY